MTNRDVLRTISGKAHKGFTLVELMVTVAIVAILASVGAPQLRAFLVKQQVRSDVDRLTTAIHMARSEALKRSGPVSICPLDASKDTPSCLATVTKTSWAQGWMVFIDYPNSSSALGTYESGRDTILLVEQGTRAGAVDTGKADTPPASLTFQAVGIGTGLAGHFDIGPKGTGGFCIQLITSITGRTSTGACS